MTQQDIISGLTWYIVFVLSTVCHEAAHSLAAFKLGDPTAKRMGLVTLDPMVHIRRSPFGMVLVPIAAFIFSQFSFMIGWASTPIDPYWAAYHRKESALTSLVGPVTNLALMAAAAMLIRVGMLFDFFNAPDQISFDLVTAASAESMGYVAVFISIFYSLNLLLFLFNILPVPPLDGSSAINLLLDDQTAEKYNRVKHTPAFQILGIIIAWNVISPLFRTVFFLSIKLLYPGVPYQ